MHLIIEKPEDLSELNKLELRLITTDTSAIYFYSEFKPISLLSHLNNNKEELISYINQMIEDNNKAVMICDDEKDLIEDENIELIKNINQISKSIKIDYILINIDTVEQLENIDNLFYGYNESYPDIYINLGNLEYEKIISTLNFIKTKLDKISPNLDKNIKYFGNYNYLVEVHRILETASSREDTLFTLNTIVNMKKNIKNYNLSPYETYMLVYDLVRDRIYKESEDYMESRDINKVLKSDKIVCAGYANLMATLLNALDIKSELMLLYNYNSPVGHARVFSLIKDEKYELDNILFSDPTFDRNQGNEEFLYSYYFFGRPKVFFNEENYYSKEFNYFSIEMLKKIQDSVETIDIGSRFKIVSNIRKIYRLLDKECIFSIENINYQFFRNIEDDTSFKKLYLEAYKLLNKPVLHEKFVQCLYHVRKIEYIINPDKYPFSLDVLAKIDEISKQYLKEEKLLERIFDTKITDLIENDEVEKDVERIKVLSKIKQYYEKIR